MGIEFPVCWRGLKFRLNTKWIWKAAMTTAMKHFVPLLCSVPDKVDVDYEPPNGTTKIYIVPVLRAARRAGMQLVYIYDDIRLVADENMIVHKIFGKPKRV